MNTSDCPARWQSVRGSPAELTSAGFSALALRHAGLSPLLKLLDSPERSFLASEFKLIERELWQLKEVGFTAKELKKHKISQKVSVHGK